MGLEIILTDEFGRKIEGVIDPQNLLPPLFPPQDDPAFPFLASIDPYGDTIFNSVQMNLFLREWATVKSKVRSAGEQDLVAAVERMATRCHDEVHTYLKFIGD